jgi:hypothetical protein
MQNKTNQYFQAKAQGIKVKKKVCSLARIQAAPLPTAATKA